MHALVAEGKSEEQLMSELKGSGTVCVRIPGMRRTSWTGTVMVSAFVAWRSATDPARADRDRYRKVDIEGRWPSPPTDFPVFGSGARGPTGATRKGALSSSTSNGQESGDQDDARNVMHSWVCISWL